MHLRKLPRFGSPAQVLQFVHVVSPVDALVGLQDLLSATRQDCAIAKGQSFHTGILDGCLFSWEVHSEFSTATLISQRSGSSTFDIAEFGESIERISNLPGKCIRSTNIALIKAEGLDDRHANHFYDEDLVVSEVLDRRAQIWSDFRLHEDGFGRMLVEDRGLVGREQVNLVQRLQELGNYRKMALLGLPMAKEAMAKLDRLETELAEAAAALASGQVETSDSMRKLSSLGAELARISAETRYRMSATRAYASIVEDRLESLHPSARPGQISLAEFTERRLHPATRTCEAFSRRLQDLTQNTAEVSGMLRTRIDTDLAQRNQELLASMDKRTELQLRLQQTVEGLSIVAITYYALGIWKALAANEFSTLLPQASMAIEFAIVMLVPLATWYSLRRIRHSKATSEPD